MKEYKPKIKGYGNPNGRCYQKSNMSSKAAFKATTQYLKDRVFEFVKQKHAMEFLNNYETIYKYVVVNYKYRGPVMATPIKNME